MKIPYFKNAHEIEIIAWPLTGGPVDGKQLQLGAKLVDYAFGQDKPRHWLLNVAEQLLTKGEFFVTDITRGERLVLADPADRTTRGQARSLCTDLMEEESFRQQKWGGEA